MKQESKCLKMNLNAKPNSLLSRLKTRKWPSRQLKRRPGKLIKRPNRSSGENSKRKMKKKIRKKQSIEVRELPS
jgi:hypothetical protein